MMSWSPHAWRGIRMRMLKKMDTQTPLAREEYERKCIE